MLAIAMHPEAGTRCAAALLSSIQLLETVLPDSKELPLLADAYCAVYDATCRHYCTEPRWGYLSTNDEYPGAVRRASWDRCKTQMSPPRCADQEHIERLVDQAFWHLMTDDNTIRASESVAELCRQLQWRYVDYLAGEVKP